jgi:hypothetical protein
VRHLINHRLGRNGCHRIYNHTNVRAVLHRAIDEVVHSPAQRGQEDMERVTYLEGSGQPGTIQCSPALDPDERVFGRHRIAAVLDSGLSVLLQPGDRLVDLTPQPARRLDVWRATQPREHVRTGHFERHVL